MAIVQQGDFITSLYADDVVNLYDMVTLHDIPDTAVTVEILVIPTDDIEWDNFNEGDQLTILQASDGSDKEYGYVTGTLNDLGNIGGSSNISNATLKVNVVGTYIVSFTNNSNIVRIELSVTQKTYRVAFKNPVTIELGNFGDNSTNNTLQLSYTGTDISNTFDIYDGETLITDEQVYAMITKLTFKLSHNNTQIRAGNTYTINSSGTYEMSLKSYISSVYVIDFENIEITVSPISYSSLQLSTKILISYGSLVPSLYEYFTVDGSDDVFTEDDFADKYTLELYDVVNDFTINSKYISTTLPGQYKLRAIFPGDGNTIIGDLVISKAQVTINSTMLDLYTLPSPTIDFTGMFTIITLGGVTEIAESERITLSVKFNRNTVSSSSYEPDTKGTLAVTVHYPGNDSYYGTSSRFYAKIGPLPIDISISRKYVFSPSEFTADKKTSVTNDILSNLSIINSDTEQSVSSEIRDIITNHATITYKRYSDFVPQCVLLYTINSGPVAEYFLEKDTIFNSILTSLRSVSSDVVSVRGIRVLPGALVSITYSSGSLQTRNTKDFPANTTNTAYAVDSNINATANNITYVAPTDSIDLSTTNITQIDITHADFTDLGTLSNGLYTIIVKIAESEDPELGVDHDTYDIVFTENATQNILISDSFNIEIDIINHLLDKLPESGRTIDHLLNEPYLDNDLSNIESSYSLNNYTINPEYMRIKFEINDTEISVPSGFASGFNIMPNFTYLAQNVANTVCTVPFGTISSAFDLYYNYAKVLSTNTYSVGLPDMIINSTKSSILDWFSMKSVTLPTTITINSSLDTFTKRLDYISNNINSDDPLVDNYDTIEGIVLATSMHDTSRPFWLALITKLNTVRSQLRSMIEADKLEYFNENDMDYISGEYTGINFNDINNFEDYFDDNPTLYNALLNNEINTLILKKYIFTSLVAIRAMRVSSIKLKYSPKIITIHGTFTNGVLSVGIDEFIGTSGYVSIDITVAVATLQGNSFSPTAKYTSYIYGKPTNALITYTSRSDTTETVSGVLDSVLYANDTPVVFGTITQGGTYTNSVRMVGTGSITLDINYKVSTFVDVKNASNISITGLTRRFVTQTRSRTKGPIVESSATQSISGPATITITQHSITS